MNDLFLFEIKYGKDSTGVKHSASIVAKDVIDAYNKFRNIDEYKKTADVYLIQRQSSSIVYV